MPAAPADGHASGRHRPRQGTVLLLRSSSRLLRSSSKVKAGQWVTPNPSRPSICG